MLLRLGMIAFMMFMFSASSLTAFSQTRPVDEHGHAWWQHAVFYEIYPRSFADSNNDGIGDLNGITSKLDYLKDLGIDAIWLTPFFPSPQVDFGYDVSDYQNIDPMYGTLEDFDRLQSAAKKRGIRIILDFVLNHTSDQHPWFLDSRSSRNSPKRDWYIWRDGKGPGQPPNNWTSTFGGSAWTLDPATGQYYYHYFYAQQPDLNWQNPAVREAMFDVTRWWYNRGVAGFRLDAVDTLFEDPQLRDNPVLPGTNKFGDPNTEQKYTTKYPEVHDTLRDLRKVADQHDAVLIGETWTKDIAELKQYYGEHSNELQMPMDLMFATVNQLSAPEFRRQIAAVDSAGGWPVFVISNHDIERSYNRYGDGQHNDAIAKLMASLYLTLRGTPIMYYGEEIGMENTDPKRKEDVKDPIGRTGWPLEKGRDGERTPMQWNNDPHAGFSQAAPWLPVPPSSKTHNVEAEIKDGSSILSVYRRLLALRRENPALRDGEYLALNQGDPHVLCYLRRYQHDGKHTSVLVALNMSAEKQQVNFDLSAEGISPGPVHTLLSTAGKQPVQADWRQMSLEPFEAYVGELSK
jgi:alpha-glucosidase